MPNGPTTFASCTRVRSRSGEHFHLSPGKELSDFLGPQYSAGNRTDQDELPGSNRYRVKHLTQRLRVNHQEMKNISQQQTTEQPSILQQLEIKGRVIFAPAIENIEPLANREHGKRFGLRLDKFDSRRKTPQEIAER